MNIFQAVIDKFQKAMHRNFKPTPADFRRGKRPLHIAGFLTDKNSRHVETFKGGIIPMKRRFRGVSLTAGKKK